jgi:anti-sigma factor RsiW
MICDSVREFIEPLLDGELEAGRRAEVESHLQSCIPCAELHHQLSQLRAAVRAGAPRYRAPAHLASRIRTSLRKADRAGSRSRAPWTWMAVAASLASAAALVWGVLLLRPQATQQDLLAQELVSSHVRSLMPGHLMDVQSTDQHTVKPWFAGKLDFSPKVKDLAPQGYPLLGGRLDYLDRRPVAALVYQARKHVINLYVWPSSLDRGSSSTENGFNLVHWFDGGLSYWAVSDLNMNELREFARVYRE